MSNTPSDETLRAEYAAAQADYFHNDQLQWSIGAVLVAGALVFWGFVLGRSSEPSVLAMGSVLLITILSIWYLFAHQCRQAYLCKLHRLQEIERLLGMQSHIRWVDSPVRYQSYGPRGFDLITLLYATITLGSLALGAFASWATLWLLIPVPAVLLVVVYVYRNERLLRASLEPEPSGSESILGGREPKRAG